ncbi:cleavage and polyadenylation specificity factor subunit 2 [Lepidopterella palustris CBS 459.81]|uniref:Cleavage and polyadenylation specificity factor subunit 2 n=1 Tax=Lepidopterella palustris CBS 459.81 TaxID=1314670 RepID=A0A8E2EGT9_9PEZI|nr:cleavage and polyadenylation specificity factor subunit 2 [Lepidopterella palustris CBS 459.81]
MFNFTPLLGAQSSSPASQSLLEFDGGIKILIDVGWDESFDVEKLKELERQVPTLSVILLTHATTAHLAAFAHCCKHFPLFTRIPIYATLPVISLGRTLLQDLYASTPLASSIIPREALSESAYSFPSFRHGTNLNILLQPPTPDEIAGYFSLIHPLKYSQPHQPLPSPFSPPLSGLTITAYSAGHTLGGTIWHLQHGLESIVYAVDWNQSREHVLSGAAWLGGAGTGGSEVLEQLRRPTALICSSRGSGPVILAGGRKKRDDTLLGMIRETVSNGGTVLIPTDSSARVLELAYLLEDAWQAEVENGDGNSPLKHVKLYLASRTSGATMRYVRSMLEWMEEGIVREFEAASSGQEAQGHNRNRSQQGAPAGSTRPDEQKAARTPFDFKYLKLLERKTQVNRLLSAEGPRVILASDTSLEWGFSKEAIRSLATDRRNLIVLTERVGESSNEKKGLGRYLWEMWDERRNVAGADAESSATAIVDASGSEVHLQHIQTAPLAGSEVPLYQQYLARQRQLQNTMQGDSSTALETSADVVDDRSSSTSTTSEDSDVEHQGKALNTAATLSHARHKLALSDAELGINILIRRKNVYDYEVRGKKGREKMFPYVAKRRRGDDFGDLIRPEEYLRAEERDEVDGEDMRDGGTKKENTVGQKRKWDDVGIRNAAGGRRMSNGANKRRRANDGGNASTGPPGSNGPRGGAAEGESDSSEGESEEEASRSIVEGPLKVVFTTESFRLDCRISFVDFSGLHDKRSIQMLIPLIKPRKLILVSGEEIETNDLAADCRKLLNTGSGEAIEGGIDVFTPSIGRTIDASVDTNAWTVKLSQSLVRRLHWQKVKGLGVVAITGRLEAASLEQKPSQEATKKKLKTIKGEGQDSQDNEKADADMDTTPILDILPANLAATTRTVTQPLHVGDLRLADLRKIMQASGMTAEFRGEGTLVINGTVAVRKSGTGKIEVDGGAYSMADPRNTEGGTFFKVKRKIYEGLAVVAGG